MESLIGVLLYIGALTTNTTYTTQEIYSIEQTNQQIVNSIEDSPTEMSAATEVLELVEVTTDGGDKIVIWDGQEF